MNTSDRAPRLQELALKDMSPEQREVHDAILSGPRGVVEGPLRVWLNSPELANRAQRLGAFCRYGTTLPPKHSELAIIVMGAFWKAGFEWHVHAPIAIKAGIDPAAVEAIRRGEQPKFTDPDAATVYAFARELITGHRVSDATYQRAFDTLGQRGIVELVGILGYYSLISMTIVAFHVPIPDGGSEPFEG